MSQSIIYLGLTKEAEQIAGPRIAGIPILDLRPKEMKEKGLPASDGVQWDDAKEARTNGVILRSCRVRTIN